MELQKFTAPNGPDIRAINEDGEIWFVASDVCAALDLSNVFMALSRLDDEEKGVSSIATLGGIQDVSTISESGLYSLVLGSRKPEAKSFKKWVTSEVLPQIRKTGAYIPVPQTLSQALRLAADQAETIEKQTMLIESQKPAVEFVERFVEAKQTQPLRAVAKVLGIKEKAFVSALLEKGVLYRLGGKLLPKAEYMGRYFEVKEVVAANGYATTQMRFTTDGVAWISRKVKEWGIDA